MVYINFRCNFCFKAEGNQSVTDCNALKMPAPDGKIRMTDMEQLFRGYTINIIARGTCSITWGTSLKGLGKRWFAFFKMNIDIIEMLDNFRKSKQL